MSETGITGDRRSSAQQDAIDSRRAEVRDRRSVEAYSGYRYGERPQAFTWQGRRYEVLDVEHRWRMPGGVGFVVTAAPQAEGSGPAIDGEERLVERWELTYDEVWDTWHIRRANVKEDEPPRGERG